MKFLRTGKIAWLVVALIKLLALTWRWRVDDRMQLSPDDPPKIWVVWHNRLLCTTVFYSRYVRFRRLSVLTSPSKDGDVLAEVVSRFGMEAIRGSSSKKGAAALRQMVIRMREGSDMAITPDGPRGPRYHLQPGLVLLAQKANAELIPWHVEYGRCIRLKSWDGFMIPLPFSTVNIRFGPGFPVRPTDSAMELEQERQRIEAMMKERMLTH